MSKLKLKILKHTWWP